MNDKRRLFVMIVNIFECLLGIMLNNSKDLKLWDMYVCIF